MNNELVTVHSDTDSKVKTIQPNCQERPVFSTGCDSFRRCGMHNVYKRTQTTISGVKYSSRITT